MPNIDKTKQFFPQKKKKVFYERFGTGSRIYLLIYLFIEIRTFGWNLKLHLAAS